MSVYYCFWVSLVFYILIFFEKSALACNPTEFRREKLLWYLFLSNGIIILFKKNIMHAHLFIISFTKYLFSFLVVRWGCLSKKKEKKERVNCSPILQCCIWFFFYFTKNGRGVCEHPKTPKQKTRFSRPTFVLEKAVRFWWDKSQKLKTKVLTTTLYQPPPPQPNKGKVGEQVIPTNRTGVQIHSWWWRHS